MIIIFGCAFVGAIMLGWIGAGIGAVIGVAIYFWGK